MRLIILTLFYASFGYCHQDQNDSSCYKKWLNGYKLATNRRENVFFGVPLKTCEEECKNQRGCPAFAYGSKGEANGTCELATRSASNYGPRQLLFRNFRVAENESFSMSDVNKSENYDVYVRKTDDHNCFETSPLYENPNDRAVIPIISRDTVCLVKLKSDVYLAPEASRTTFRVRSFEDCRMECLRSYENLRFECRLMSFRYESNSEGSCALSDVDHRQLRERDYIPARSRYDSASVFFYDDRDPLCRQHGHSNYDGRSRTDFFDNRGYNYNDRYNGGNYHRDWYYGQNRGRYDDYRYPSRSSGDYYNDRNYYRPWSGDFFNGNYNYGRGRDDDNRFDRNHADYAHGTGHETVNGERCQRSCRQNRDAGFFYCEIDHEGNWDFCCRPGQVCGFSPGFDASWCYVGSGPTQNMWRSCNRRSLNRG